MRSRHGQAAYFGYSGTRAVRLMLPLRRASELRRQLPYRIRPALQLFCQLHQIYLEYHANDETLAPKRWRN